MLVINAHDIAANRTAITRAPGQSFIDGSHAAAALGPIATVEEVRLLNQFLHSLAFDYFEGLFRRNTAGVTDNFETRRRINLSPEELRELLP